MKRLNLRKILLVSVIVMTLGATLLTGCTSITSTETTTVTSGTSIQLPSIADVVALVKPSVVAINTEVTTYDFFNRPYTQEGAGSGWVIDSDGIIVTNNHVVDGANSITVTTASGETYTADSDSVFTDPISDLAIIKIDAANLPALTLGTAANMRVGDWVIAIGNALGQGIRATEGIVSRQGVWLQLDINQTLDDLIETSAAINPGNSGGPLVNLAGEVIGITNAKISSVGVESMGYAISIDTAAPLIQQLVNKGYITRPWLGVRLYTVDQMAIAQLNLTVNKGVLVTEIIANSPAEKAGLEKWDVISSIGGEEVTNIDELTKVLESATIGQPLEIKYWRGDKEYTTSAIPIESPKP